MAGFRIGGGDACANTHSGEAWAYSQPENRLMNGPVQRFVITDLRIPFFRLVLFFVKAALAAIPAAIIVGFLVMVVTAVIAAILGGSSMDSMMGRWRL
jgi:hypothetical protein